MLPIKKHRITWRKKDADSWYAKLPDGEVVGSITINHNRVALQKVHRKMKKHLPPYNLIGKLGNNVISNWYMHLEDAKSAFSYARDQYVEELINELKKQIHWENL